MKRFVVVLILFVSVPVCTRGEGIPCWVRCHHPPQINASNAQSVVKAKLRPQSNPRLRFIDRASGVLTTYWGKMLGIQGWRDYHLTGVVIGSVVHAAGSTDLLYTIDVQIDELKVGGSPVMVDPGSRFIRIEVFPLVRIHAPLPVYENQRICVSGRLMWDADGFLEIHPKHRSEFGCSVTTQQKN